MRKKWLAAFMAAAMTAGTLAGCGQEAAPAAKDDQPAAESGTAGEEASAKTVEELLLEPYEEPVDIHVVLQYRESEDPDTPEDVTPETSTAVKLLKEELNINLIYDWIVNADQLCCPPMILRIWQVRED